jgi:pimeloyl-ACP methyl ester carboxylesterase
MSEFDHERLEVHDERSGISERTEGKRKGKGRGKVRRDPESRKGRRASARARAGARNLGKDGGQAQGQGQGQGEEESDMSETSSSVDRDVLVDAGPIKHDGRLTIPHGARGLVLFAHGSGSSRFSPRNQFVASALQRAGLATLLMDLLTLEEEEEDAVTARLRFDIPLLSVRLAGATDWLERHLDTRGLEIGYFGSSTGGAAALLAAVERPERVRAVVSRGGRPDLAGNALPLVRAPTLLIVGSLDETVVELNIRALERLRCEKRLEIVPDATHLFEEPGTLEAVARLAASWFQLHLGGAGAARSAA